MNIPTIRLELEGMRETIIAGLMKYNDELEGIVKDEIDRQINQFTVEGYIKDEVYRELTRMLSTEIRNQLSYIFAEEVTETIKNKILENIKPKEQS